MSKKKVTILNSKDLEEIRMIKGKKNRKSPIRLNSLIIQISVKENIDKEKVRRILREFFLNVAKHSKQYSHVSLYGFGTFKEKKIKSKYIKVPGSEKLIKTKEKKYLCFTSSFEI